MRTLLGEARELVPEETYLFGDFELNVDARALLREGKRVHAEPKVFDLLVDLVRHRNRVVGRDELLARLWADTVVCTGALNQCVAMLRRTLGESATQPRYLMTLPRRGYRFVSPSEPAVRARASVRTSDAA